jgi:hypothetical protein
MSESPLEYGDPLADNWQGAAKTGDEGDIERCKMHRQFACEERKVHPAQAVEGISAISRCAALKEESSIPTPPASSVSNACQ